MEQRASESHKTLADVIILDDDDDVETFCTAIPSPVAAAWAELFVKPSLIEGKSPPGHVLNGVRCVTWASALAVSRATSDCVLPTSSSATNGSGIRLSASALSPAPTSLGGRALVLDLDGGRSWCAIIRGAVPEELRDRLVSALDARPDAGWPVMLYRMRSGAVVESKRGSFVVQDPDDALDGEIGAQVEPWSAHHLLAELRASMIARLGLGAPSAYNAALVHRYRPRRLATESSPGASDELGYHSDLFYGGEVVDAPLGQVVVSLSFGARRSFDIKRRDTKAGTSAAAKGRVEPGFLRLEVNNGDCIVMLGAMQDGWLHRVPALTKAEAGSASRNRYNITLRRCIAGKPVGGHASGARAGKGGYDGE